MLLRFSMQLKGFSNNGLPEGPPPKPVRVYHNMGGGNNPRYPEIQFQRAATAPMFRNVPGVCETTLSSDCCVYASWPLPQTI